jgi:hypothetical protein
MATQQRTLKRAVAHTVFFIYALVKNFLQAFQRKCKLMVFYQRRPLISFLSEPIAPLVARPRVLVNISHIAPVEEAKNPHKAAYRIDRLRRTIDGLLTSFSHCNLTIAVSSLPDRNVVQYLPAYQRQCVHLKLQPNCDPLYVGFRVQDELVDSVDQFDWFVFIEDDILINDSCFLDKIAAFHQHSTVQDVLLPNRYEFLDGTKRYIDLTIESEMAWNRLSAFKLGDIKFAECINPHSGMYCLSQAQIKYWARSKRTWKNQIVMVGPLESAATFCLLECFNLYKPHSNNLHYLEVQHYDTKYSKLYPKPHSPYTLTPVRPKGREVRQPDLQSTV